MSPLASNILVLEPNEHYFFFFFDHKRQTKIYKPLSRCEKMSNGVLPPSARKRVDKVNMANMVKFGQQGQKYIVNNGIIPTTQA